MKLTRNQELANNVREGNYVVSASAGSGKTAVLTSRVYSIIKEGTSLDELLVLTFTNLAAAEMRERIRKNLLEENDPKYLEIVAAVDAANIQTFDAYALNLVKKYYYVIDVPKDISLVDKSLLDIKEKKLLDGILNKHFDENDERVLSLIDEYCLKNADELKAFILEISHKFDLKKDKKAFLETYLDDFYSESRIKKCVDEFIAQNKKKIADYYSNIKKFDNVDYVDAVSPLFEKILSLNTYDEFHSFFESEEYTFPRSAGALSLKDYQDDAAYVKYVKSKIESFRGKLGFDNYLDLENQYFDTKKNVETLIRLVKELDEKISIFKKEYNVYTFSDIFKFALEIASKPSINKELKNKYKYIMIDEYQDTSDIQEDFINLIANNNVYVVGDVKQSIYRFRNANCDLFLNKFNRYGKGDGGTRIELPDNFRSRKEVVDSINKVFTPLMNNDNTGLDYKNEHQMIHGNKSYISANSDYSTQTINYLISDKYTKAEQEARLIAIDILNKVKSHFEVYDKKDKVIREVRYSDFAIMISRKADFALFQKIFNEYQIPLYTNYDKKIRDNNLTMTFESIINLLCLYKNEDYSNKFLHSFISVLRSFLFRVNDQDIENLVYDKNYSRFELFDIIKNISETSKKHSLKEVVELVIKEFNIYEKLITLGDVSNNISLLQYYHSIAEQMDHMGYSLEDFKQYFDDLEEFDIDPEYSPNDDIEDCVTLLSIHASKGLQFKICYLAELYKKFNETVLNKSFLVDSTYGIDVPNVNHKSTKTLLHTIIAEKEKNELLREQLRLFYVALTRAEEKLILLVNPMYRKTSVQDFGQCSSFLDFLFLSKANFDSYSFEISPVKRTIKEKEKEIKQVSFFESISMNNELVEDKHASKELDADIDEELLRLGNKYHYYLELIDFNNIDTSFIKDENDKKRIDKFLANSLFKGLKNVNVMHEYPFYDEKNNVHGVIDLMIEKEDSIDIIDFKLSHVDDASYDKQVRTYKNYISQLTDKKINTYVTGILSNDIRKVD